MTQPCHRDGIVTLVVSGEGGFASVGRRVVAVIFPCCLGVASGIEFSGAGLADVAVIPVEPGGTVPFGGRVNVDRPQKGGAQGHQKPQKQCGSVSHRVHSTVSTLRRQVSGVE